ncbi:MAG: response regulator transcription factor [Candidatus Sericytochromatia bacterium]|nr:response regulator transcription factor [Candidatus Sericytochromatia bacterium]
MIAKTPQAVTLGRILIVEDDPMTVTLLTHVLTEAGYAVTVAEDGQQGLSLGLSEPFDMLILDWMLPSMEGVDVCKRLRADKDLPIIFLTARDAVVDRVTGLRSGADDYVIKPVAPEELLARVEAQLRRQDVQHRAHAQAPELRYADLVLWPLQHRAMRGDRDLALTKTEQGLLSQFMHKPEEVLTKAALTQAVWGPAGEATSNLLDSYVRFLRKKLETNGGSRLIRTVHSVGYVLQSQPDSSP